MYVHVHVQCMGMYVCVCLRTVHVHVHVYTYDTVQFIENVYVFESSGIEPQFTMKMWDTLVSYCIQCSSIIG